MTSKFLKSIAILSQKGGVGKTSIAVNLAVHLAKLGNRVCILEHDFHGPSLSTFFKPSSNWLNDYLLGDEKLENCIQDQTSKLGLAGKLFIGFADPTHEAIHNIIRIDQKTSIQMLKKLMNAKKLLKEDPFNLDYLIIDCSPGLGFSTVNVILTTDTSLFIVKLSNADIIGTSQMIAGLHKQLKNRSMVVANLIPSEVLEDIDQKKEIQKLIEQRFQQDIGNKVVDFLGWIPTDLQLQRIEFDEAVKSLHNQESSRVIYTLTQPDHIFSKTINNLVSELFKEAN
ncbi:MAG: MinD/ParA family protein [Candidatus Odinarchaeota archaeon]